MLPGNSFGNKYQPSLIFKTTTPLKKETAAENNAKRHGFGKRLWIKMCDLQSTFGVQIYANATAWWNAQMSVRFLEYHFDERRERHVSPILLVWDDFPHTGQNECEFALKSLAWCSCECLLVTQAFINLLMCRGMPLASKGYVFGELGCFTSSSTATAMVVIRSSSSRPNATMWWNGLLKLGRNSES